MVKWSVIGLLIGMLVIQSNTAVLAQTYPPNFGQVLVAGGLTNPTAMAFAPDGRIFVAEQGGKLRIIKNNTLLAAAFVQLTVSSAGERGLIGVALDPDFSSNHYVYLYHTVPGTPPHNRISRFTADGDVAQAGSEFVVLDLDPLSTATNHNGGAMHFSNDGKLFVAIGENANSANAQNLNTYHGKILRINKDGTVPDGNPFTTGSEQRRRIWAYGLRNPFTFSIHPESGRILVNDVGQVTWEEINDATTGGKNFGWPTTEGNFNPVNYPNLTNPIYVYPHGSGDGKGCAITGGTFFSPDVTNYPAAYAERYFFQDLCNRWINVLDVSGAPSVKSSFATGIPGNSVALTAGNDGNIYYLSRTANALYKIIYNQSTVPYITQPPGSLTVAEGQPATFSVKALGSLPIQYQWQKDGVDIEDATEATYKIPMALPSDEGNYTVVISNGAGIVVSEKAALVVTANALPVAEILTPGSGTTYAAGETIEFSGTGNDEEDGALPPAAFRWQVNFHHDMHQHDEPPVEGSKTGSFVVPVEGETSENVWYRIMLTVTDSQGSTGVDSVDVFPRKSTFFIETDPPGLQVTIEGQPVPAPVEVASVEGLLRTIGVTSPQVFDGVTYTFESWSNGGEATQTLPTPVDDIHLTANFSIVVSTESQPGEPNGLLFPNPSNNEFVSVRMTVTEQQEVSIQLVDLISRQVSVLKEILPPGEHTVPFYLGKLAKGVYTVIIKTKSGSFSRKLVIED